VNCHACNATLSPEDSFCTDCGAPCTPAHFCTECGTRGSPDLRFCTECGTAFDEAEATVPTCFCTECGARSEPGARFCIECGTPVEASTVKTTPPGPVAPRDAPAVVASRQTVAVAGDSADRLRAAPRQTARAVRQDDNSVPVTPVASPIIAEPSPAQPSAPDAVPEVRTRPPVSGPRAEAPPPDPAPSPVTATRRAFPPAVQVAAMGIIGIAFVGGGGWWFLAGGDSAQPDSAPSQRDEARQTTAVARAAASREALMKAEADMQAARAEYVKRTAGSGIAESELLRRARLELAMAEQHKAAGRTDEATEAFLRARGHWKQALDAAGAELARKERRPTPGRVTARPDVKPVAPPKTAAAPKSADAPPGTPPDASERLPAVREAPPVQRRPVAAGLALGMVTIPGGSFLMGSPADEPGRLDNEGPQRRVEIRSFRLSKVEITFEQFDAFATATGRVRPDDAGWGRGNRPVISVSWDDATAFAEWLSEQTGERYRLPTEAEWEYAARAGSTTSYPWGSEPGSNNANCSRCGSEWGSKQTAPSGSFPPNEFGLHDMHGNVWEWVQDCYKNDYIGAPSGGSAPAQCDTTSRVLRGGSWQVGGVAIRSASRIRRTPISANNTFGFRVAQTIE